MQQAGKSIGIVVALVLVAGPLLMGLTGLIRARRTSGDAAPELAMPCCWKLTVNSALVALAAVPAIDLWLARPLLSLAEGPARIASARARTRFIFHVATLPALISILLIIPFRVPREFVEVVMPPVVVALIGIAWIQAGAWCVSGVTAGGGSGAGSVAYPLGAALLLLLVFQLLLRPGIRFYRAVS